MNKLFKIIQNLTQSKTKILTLAWTTNKTTHKIPKILVTIILNDKVLDLFEMQENYISASIVEWCVLNDIEIQWDAVLYIAERKIRLEVRIA